METKNIEKFTEKLAKTIKIYQVNKLLSKIPKSKSAYTKIISNKEKI